MKLFILLIFLIVFQSINVFGQSGKDSIIIRNSHGDVKCYKNGVLLTNMDYNVLLKNSPTALEEIKLARSNYKSGTVIEYIGAFVVGFCLGSAISGEQVDSSWWLTLGSGAVVASTGIMIYNVGKRHHRNSVMQYNSTLGTSLHNTRNTLEFGPGNKGLALVYKF